MDANATRKVQTRRKHGQTSDLWRFELSSRARSPSYRLSPASGPLTSRPPASIVSNALVLYGTLTRTASAFGASLARSRIAYLAARLASGSWFARVFPLAEPALPLADTLSHLPGSFQIHIHSTSNAPNKFVARRQHPNSYAPSPTRFVLKA